MGYTQACFSIQYCSIFFSNLESNIKSLLANFVYDTKIGGVINNEKERATVQTDLKCMVM